jgi:hypothetical protein
MKMTRIIAALLFCALSTLANAGSLNWSLDRSGGSPYKLRIDLDGVWHNFGEISSAGQPLPYFASTFCNANEWITATAGVPSCSQPAFSNISGDLDLATQVTGTLAVGNGGTGITSGTSGGVLAFTAAGTLASSSALTANMPVIGGGAGVAPGVGTRSGNTTQFVTTTGAQTSGDCVSIDANGNHIASGAGCGTGGGSIALHASDYGAVGDNVADDTTALQNWINACQTAKVICYLDPGTYKTSTTLNITSALRILGASRTAATINPNATSINAILINTTEQVDIQGIGVTYATAADNGTYAIGVTGTGSGNGGSTLRNLYFINAWCDIKVIEAQYMVISDNIGQANVTLVDGARSVWFAVESANAWLGDHTVYGNTFAKAGNTYGVYITGGSGIRITNNKIVGDNSVGSYGVFYNLFAGAPAEGMSDIQIVGNSIENKAIGVHFKRNNATSILANVQVNSNQFLMLPSGGSQGIVISTDPVGKWLSTATFNDNIAWGGASGSASYCYNFDSAEKVTVSGNVCRAPGGGTTIGLNIGSALSGIASDNNFSGTTARYTGGSANFVIVDHLGVNLANLPSAAASGSQLTILNGTPGSIPCTSGGGGAMGFRLGGAWKCF